MSKDTPNMSNETPRTNSGATNTGVPNTGAPSQNAGMPNPGAPTVNPDGAYPQSAFTYPSAQPTDESRSDGRSGGTRIALLSVAGVALAALLFGGGFWAGTAVDDGPGMSHSRMGDGGPGWGELGDPGGGQDEGRYGGPGDRTDIRPDNVDPDDLDRERTEREGTERDSTERGDGQETTPETDEESGPATVTPSDPSLFLR